MNRTVLILLSLQTVLMGCALTMSLWAEMPALGIMGIVLTSLSILAGERAGIMMRPQFSKQALTVAWIGVLIALTGLLLPTKTVRTLDSFQAFIPWLFAIAVLAAAGFINDARLKCGWRMLGTALAFAGSSIWLITAYTQNSFSAFHFGLFVIFSLLILSKFWFQMPAGGILFANTVILLLIGVPVVDLIVRGGYEGEAPVETQGQYFSYEAAKKDPLTFARWWSYYLEQIDQIRIHLREPDPAGILPFRLKPNSHCLIGQCDVSINSRGMRGVEFPVEKGNSYRIVAIGESTTFGITLQRDDQPWPELLEELIRARLKPGRPVEVINAGIPSFDIRHNLLRLQTDILPLHPDMIISYHGFNGFYLLGDAMPKMTGKRPPAWRERPLKLLADCEYNLKMFFYRRRHDAPDQTLHPISFPDPMGTGYAAAYRELIGFVETNRIRLALASFSMAVNDRSEVDVVQFYRKTFPFVYMQIQANAVHSKIVERLAEEYPGVIFVDTHPALDGNHEKFVDLIHFTQDGRRQLAENMFGGIKETLEKDLSHP